MFRRFSFTAILVIGLLMPINAANAANCTTTESTFVGDGTNSTVSGRNYFVVTITDTSGCEWQIPSQVRNADILTVGGGGGGGGGSGYYSSGNGGGGGGGGGGVDINYSVSFSGFNSLTIQVGAGGSAGAVGLSGQNGSAGSSGGSTSIYELGINTNGGGGGIGGRSGLGGAGGSSGNGGGGGIGGNTSPYYGGSGASSTSNGVNASNLVVGGTSVYFSSLSSSDTFSVGGGGGWCTGYGSFSSANGSGGKGGRGAQYNGCGTTNSSYTYGYLGSAGIAGVVIIRYWIDTNVGGYYCPNPQIESISPDFGPETGGNQITILGDFLTKNFTINDSQAEVVSISSKKAVLIAPPGIKGIAKFEAKNTCGSNKSNYYYNPDPLILDYTKSYVPVSGDTFVILGKYLTNAKATISGLDIKILINTDSMMILQLPSMQPGLKQISITTQFGLAILPVNYLASPNILTIQLPEYISQGQFLTIEPVVTDAKIFSITGILPSGLDFNNKTGLISGITSASGTYEFQLNAINEVGIDTKKIIISIDKPKPAEINTVCYFKFRSAELSESSINRLQKVIEKALEVEPNLLGATIRISLGGEISNPELRKLRLIELSRYFVNSGIRIKNLDSLPGNNFRSEISISWVR